MNHFLALKREGYYYTKRLILQPTSATHGGSQISLEGVYRLTLKILPIFKGHFGRKVSILEIFH